MNTYGDPGADPAEEWRVERMTDTITPASLRAHADWIGNGSLPAAEHLRREADRLEAEAARDEEAEKLAKVFHAGMLEGQQQVYGDHEAGWDSQPGEVKRVFIAGARAVLAADGRLLPEGGTDWQKRAEKAESELEERALPVGGWLLDAALNDAHNAGMDTHDWELVQSDGDVTEAVQAAISAALNKLASALTPPAGSVPDSGPDGTPEKPWPNLHAIPQGVDRVRDKYRNTWERTRDGWSDGTYECIPTLKCWSAGHPAVAPFVRVDGDKA